MRAAGLLPLLLLLGLSSQDDSDPSSPDQASTTVAMAITTASSGTTTATSAVASTTAAAAVAAATTATSTEKATQAPVAAPTTVQSTSAAQSTTAAADTGNPPPPAAMSPAGASVTTPTTPGSAPSATTVAPRTSGQDTHSASSPTAIAAAASSAPSAQPSSAADSSGSSGTPTAANPVLASGTSPPGAVGTAAASSATQPQGKQPLEPLPNTTASIAVPRTDPSQSSKDCADPSAPCPTKQPPSSSSPPVQGPIPFTSPGSTNASVPPPTGSPSLATTRTPPMSQPGTKDTVPEAAPTTAPGADQSTRDAGPASAKPTSASQSPASTQPSAPAPGDHPDQAGSCRPELLQHQNLSSPNEFECEDQMELTRPTIHLKKAKTCDEWRMNSTDISFFVSFCSTAQHVFDADREWCTVKMMACKPVSHEWAVQVVLHRPLDSEEVLKELKEKDKLEALGIASITSDKTVEDMTINDEFSTPLIITIITLAVSLLLIAAIYGCYQRFSHKKDQNIHPDVPGFDDGHVALIFNQRLTEEMQTMENGYHDNPTLEVMETSSEMQEKKVNLNGELGDSWIVPLDTLMKEDLEEEEDTHL